MGSKRTNLSQSGNKVGVLKTSSCPRSEGTRHIEEEVEKFIKDKQIQTVFHLL